MSLMFVDDDNTIFINEKTIVDKHDVLQYIINKKFDIAERKSLSYFEKKHFLSILSEMYDFVHDLEYIP